MKNQFSIGQLVVMQHGKFHTEHNGQLAVIIGALAVRRALNASTMTEKNILCYELRVLCTPTPALLAMPHQLRALGDPRAGQVRRDGLGRPIRRYLRIKGPDGKAVAGQESLEVKWFGFDEIPWDDYSFPSSKKSLSHFLKIKDQPQNTWVPRMETLDPVGR